jgi:hypothetical protein
VAEIFESFDKLKLTLFQILIFVLSAAFPILAHTPSPRKTLVQKFKQVTDEISDEMLERAEKEKESAFEGKKDYSIIGLLSMSLIYLHSLCFEQLY